MSSDDEPVTLINVFEIEPENVDAFAAEWRQRAEVMSRTPGCLGYALHKAISTDTRFQLVNVARWASGAALRAAQQNPEFSTRRDNATGHIAAHPALYRVVASYTAADTAGDPA